MNALSRTRYLHQVLDNITHTNTCLTGIIARNSEFNYLSTQNHTRIIIDQSVVLTYLLCFNGIALNDSAVVAERVSTRLW